MVGKHTAHMSTVQTSGVFQFPADLYKSYESAAHFRKLHGDTCVAAFLTGFSFEGTALATYTGTEKFEDVKSKFSAAVDKSFTAASVKGQVDASYGKSLAEEQKNWQVQVDYAIVGAGMARNKLVTEYAGLVEIYKTFTETCTPSTAQRYGFYVLPWSSISGFQWGRFKGPGLDQVPMPLTVIDRISEAAIYQLLKRVEDIAAIITQQDDYISVKTGGKVQRPELQALQAHGEAVTKCIEWFRDQIAAGKPLHPAVPPVDQVEPAILKDWMPKLAKEMQNHIKPEWYNLQNGESLAGKQLRVREVVLPNALPLRNTCGERMTIGRVWTERGVQLGKYWDRAGQVFYAPGPGEPERKHGGPFQVLANPEKFTWRKLDTGIPATAIPCGKTLDDKDLYVAACIWPEQKALMIVGKAIDVTSDMASFESYGSQAGVRVSYSFADRDHQASPADSYVMCYA